MCPDTMSEKCSIDDFVDEISQHATSSYILDLTDSLLIEILKYVVEELSQ